MPNRIIREDILTSERVNALSLEAELFYRHLMSVVDDYGRFSGNLKTLRSRCYPHKIEWATEERIALWLDEVCNVHKKVGFPDALVILYEVDGRDYLELCNFKQSVRAKESKYPPLESAQPKQAPVVQPQAPATHMQASAPQVQASAPVVGGVDEGVDVAGLASRLYAAHPVKRNKALVEHECVKLAKRGAEHCAMVEQRHKAWCDSDEWRRDGGRYVPGLDKWLSDEGYTAVPAHVKAASGGVQYRKLGSAA